MPGLPEEPIVEPELVLAPRPGPPKVTQLPGVNFMTSESGSSNLGPLGRWKTRAGRLVAVMWNPKTQKEFKPFLEEAQEWLEGACTQLALAAGGVCGPIEMNALATAAWQTAYARYWMHLASEDPSNLRLFETASRVADAARANSLAAYDIAVRLSRNKGGDAADPLAKFEAAVQVRTTLTVPSQPSGFPDDDLP